MTVLRRFCCCGSLKSGTIFAAVAGIILAVVGIILMFTLNIDLRTILLDSILPKWAVKVILVINFCMTILISTFLLVGAMKRNMYFMLPWVILGLLLAVALLVSIIVTAITLFNEDEDISAIVWLVAGIVSVLVVIYFWLVVFSYFQIVKEEHMERSKYQRAPFRRHY